MQQPKTQENSTLNVINVADKQLDNFLWRDFFGKSAELLQKLSECSEENLTMADLLVALFYLPTPHLHEYSRLLLKLATCFEVVGETSTSQDNDFYVFFNLLTAGSTHTHTPRFLPIY